MPTLLVYLVAPGSRPQAKNSTRRIALPDHGIPIVGIALQFPLDDALDNIRRRMVVKVSGIEGEV